jgi:enamine deaminase RidA (YjgF/YER057c/UK114 family)
VSRRSIEVPGLGHGTQPFPMASRVGPLLCTSAVHGVDPATGALPADPAAQIAQVFANLDAVLAAAGGTLEDVAQVLVTLVDKAHRPLVNDEWVRRFPDEASRPARNTQERPLAPGQLCTVLATAWLAGE